jgi:hypothetical protein
VISNKWFGMNGKQLIQTLLTALIIGGFWFSFIPNCRSAEPTKHPKAKNIESAYSWEQELLALLNKCRIENYLPPLVLDESLTRIAQEHSLEMAKEGIISHDQPSGDLQARMNRAGYFFNVVRENIASSRSINYAHAGFLKSPIHRENILAKDVTHIGISVVRRPYPCEKYVVVTEILAAPHKTYPASIVQNVLVDQIKKLQIEGAITANSDPLLDKMASRSLDSLPVPYDHEKLRNLLSESADECINAGKTDLSRMEVIVQLIRNPKEISFPPSKRQRQAIQYGSAVRQTTDSRNQPAFLVMTLLTVSH